MNNSFFLFFTSRACRTRTLINSISEMGHTMPESELCKERGIFPNFKHFVVLSNVSLYVSERMGEIFIHYLVFDNRPAPATSYDTGTGIAGSGKSVASSAALSASSFSGMFIYGHGSNGFWCSRVHLLSLISMHHLSKIAGLSDQTQ